MRWSLRRRKGAAPAAPVVGPAEPATPAAPRPVREWALLAPLPVTVARTAPLVIGPAPVLPPLPGPREVTGPPVTPLAGRVEGMAMVLPPRPKAPGPGSVDTGPVAPPVPVVHRPARPMPVEVPSLTDAVDEYVGEPRVAAEPYRAPGWLRYTPSWLEQGGVPGLDAIAEPPSLPEHPGLAMITPPSFIPAEASHPTTPQAPAELPPPVQEVRSARPPEGPPTVLKRRRASLADSRRLGLGSPTSRPADEPFVLPSQQELVLPPPAAEPEVLPEPEPVAVEPVVVEEEEPPPPEPEPPAGAAAVPAPGPAPVPTAERPAPERVVRPNYRTTPPPKAAPKKTLQKAVVVTKPPTELVDALRNTQRVDVADVPVYRGPKVGEEAKRRGARAFASGGAVFLPDDDGSPAARGLLAHELVHAVQQRTFGAKLPSPATPEGQALEAEAVAAERWYAGEAGAPTPAPLIHAPQPAAPRPATEVSEVDMSGMAQLAPVASSPPVSPAPQAGTLNTPFDEPTRQAVGEIAETRARTVVQQWTNPALGGSGFSGGNTGSSGSTGSGGGTGGTGGTRRSSGAGGTSGSGGGASTFNPEARRESLIADRLAALNYGRNAGDPDITDLTPEQLQQIDEQVEAEAAQHGVTVPQAEPEKPLTTGQRWIRAFGGDIHESAYNPVAGFRAEVGSEESWFASKVDPEERDAAHITADIGLMSHDQNSGHWQDWMESSNDQQTLPDVDAGKQGPSRTYSQAERNAHGRPSQEDHPFNMDQLDMDELTSRIYDRLRSRMRSELLVDRERSGRLTDFR